MNFEKGGIPKAANDNELLAELENEAQRYEEYVRLREEAPSAVRAELEDMLGGPLESANPVAVHKAAQKLFDEYVAHADGEGNVNRMKAKVAATIADGTKPFVTAFNKIEALRAERPEIPLPRIFANDNSPEQNRVAA